MPIPDPASRPPGNNYPQAGFIPNTYGAFGLPQAGLPFAVPWNPTAFLAAVGGQVLSGSGCNEGTLFLVEFQQPISKVGLSVNVQSGNLDVGIYDTTGSGGGPGNRLGSNGGTACPAAGPAAIPLSSTIYLAPGFYWALWSGDNITEAMNFTTPNQGLRAVMPGTSWRCRNTTGGMYPLAAVAVNNAVYTADSNVVQIVPSS